MRAALAVATIVVTLACCARTASSIVVNATGLVTAKNVMGQPGCGVGKYLVGNLSSCTLSGSISDGVVDSWALAIDPNATYDVLLVLHTSVAGDGLM
jgi:hypothetical protein